ncbi:MAG TPA: pyrroline-5-carboxylate reductase [Nitrosomonas halophila]|nr:pyrroline-5-carboxylate reductase [Nitrosomonas halophila]
MNITFIGGGNMASAIIGGLIQNGSQPASICVVEIDAHARERLVRQFGITVTEMLADGIDASDIIVFAIKPQQLQALAVQARQLLQNKLVISIAAGIRTLHLSQWLDGHARIIRAMPNTPALIGKGATGLYAQPSVDNRQKEQAEIILGAVGTVLWVDEEILLDAVTAISGSGPAYVFYFLEAMQEAGVELGLTADIARQLTLQTFLGATDLAAQSDEAFNMLRSRVTSKGGTTEQALLSLEQSAVKQAFKRAIRASYDRSLEMGEILGRTES